MASAFPTEGGGLQRYAAVFDAAEINTTFYRSHRAATYARWADGTPVDFRFAVKLAKAITHERKLVDVGDLLAAAVGEARLLGDRLGPLLVQLPPSLAFDPAVAGAFLTALRGLYAGAVALEPRHATWFADDADALLRTYRVARVAADPARHPGAEAPGGWPELAYWRLHGSPRMYFSAYGPVALKALCDEIAASAAEETWVIFDNTASGAAAADALALRTMVEAAGLA